ncbi:MAG: methylated-DNA--[protein]-cysteine S-methyltransferase [Acidimicrobiales bacterium]
MDLAVALARLEVEARPPHLDGADVFYAVHDAPVGALVLAATREGTLVACSYDAEDVVAARLAARLSPRVLREPRRLDEARRQVDAYVAGRRRSFDVPTSPVLATPFARRVLGALVRVPYGSTTTYQAIARAIGAPRASRAVGRALGANPLCIVLPCHRVLRSDGSLGGYAGGLAAKRHLLDVEAEI